MVDLDTALERIEHIAPDLRACGVTEAAVFGSLARGEFNESSDIDVLVDFEPSAETYDNLLAVAELLESAIGFHVDLVTRNGLSPLVAPYVEREARRAEIGSRVASARLERD